MYIDGKIILDGGHGHRYNVDVTFWILQLRNMPCVFFTMIAHDMFANEYDVTFFHKSYNVVFLFISTLSSLDEGADIE